MAESIYSYINKFPIIKLKIEEKENVTKGPNYEQCDAFKSSNSTIFKDNGESFSPKCKKIAEYQDEIIKDDNSYKPALCKYINHWFYGMLNETDPNSQYDLLSKFYHGVQSLKDCKTYQKPMKKEVHDEVKELYEMYDDFEKFKKESLKPNNLTCSELTKCFSIYNKYLDKCKDVYKHGLCMNVKNFKYEYDDHRKIAKSCTDKMKELDTLRTDLESIILLPFVVMTLITFILLFLYKVNKNSVKKKF